MEFTKSDLKELANAQSYKRGLEYYNDGAVRKVVGNNFHFEGKVIGSEIYQVSLDIEDGDLDFECDCPYDYDGICKHCVALGLAIIEGEFTTSKEVSETKPPIAMESFATCYSKTDNKKKLEFLTQVLAKDIALQNQFCAFVQNTSKASDHEDDITEIAKEIFEKLSELEFDDAIENSHSYNYDDDDDDDYEAAYSLIEDVLSPYNKKASKKLKQGDLLEGFSLLLAMYEGCQNLPDPNDEYYAFEDGYSERALEYVYQHLADFSKEIASTVLSDENIKKTIDLFFEREDIASKCIGEQIIYDIADFESILMSMLISADVASYLFDKIEEHDHNCIGIAHLMLKIADLVNMPERWFETAEKYSDQSLSVAQTLLERYKLTKQTDNFYHLASVVFEKWPNNFDRYLYDSLDKENQISLYLAVLENLTKRECSIKHYNELRAYFTFAEKNRFIQYLSTSFRSEFYIKVLEIEKRYDEILAYAHKNKKSSGLEDIVRSIINIYPKECFEILTTKVEQDLNSPGRNRSTYQNMVKLMRLLPDIKGEEAETTVFLQTIFANRLPALKDEMIKAKLIKK